LERYFAFAAQRFTLSAAGEKADWKRKIAKAQKQA